MNTNFSEAVSKFQRNEVAAGKAFGSLMTFAYDVVKDLTGDGEAVSKVLGNSVKAEEQAYREAHDAKHPKQPLTSFPGAYRSAKSVILSAVKAGVSLVDADGKLRAKSDLEASVKSCKEDKSPMDKFTGTMSTAGKIFANVDNLEDVRKCKALVAILADQVMKAEASMMGDKHREKADLTDEEKAFIAAELQAKAAA